MTVIRTHAPLVRLDGTVVLAPSPTFADLIRHAERFGVDCVAETGAECLGVDELTSLIEALDRIEAVQDSKLRYSRLRRRKPAEIRARVLLGIEDPQTTALPNCQPFPPKK